MCDIIEYYLHVDDVLRRPWACKSLEWLSRRIVGLDRLNDNEKELVDRVHAQEHTVEDFEEKTRAMEKFARCRAQHHNVYDCLASLTKLKHLELGCGDWDQWRY